MWAYWNVIQDILSIFMILAIPCLTFLAYRGWSKRSASELPRWRRGLGLTSILLVSLSWLAFFGFFLLISLFRAHLSGDILILVVSFTLLLGILSAFALRTPSRPLTLCAGLLMILVLWGSINF
jgi:hypothetical protein